MPLVIEDGSGISTAESYVGIDDATDFFNVRNLPIPTDAILLQAMDVLEGLVYVGTPTVIGQALSFPRKDIANAYSIPYGENEIPKALKNAQLWLGHYIEAGFNPASVATPAVKREKVSVLETEYFGSGDSASTSEKVSYSVKDLPNVFSFIEHLLDDASLTDDDNDSFGNGRSNRA